MDKTLKYALIGTSGLVVVYAVYYFFLKKTKKNVPSTNSNPYSNVILPVVEQTPENITKGCVWPIKKGVYDCTYVKALQFALNNIPKANHSNGIGCESKCFLKPLVEDGDFGPKTKALLEDTFGTEIFFVKDGIKKEDLELIYTYVKDPVSYQAAENPYVVEPPKPNLPTIDWSSGVPVIK